MKYIIILAITMSSCVIREKRCCAPIDCYTPEPKKVVIDPIETKHIPTYEQFFEHELRLQKRQNERRLKLLERNLQKHKNQQYHELQTRVHPVYIKSTFTDSLSSIKRIINIDTNRN